MGDDNNIRSLFSSKHRSPKRALDGEARKTIHEGGAKSDVERRVMHRRAIEGTDFSLLTEEDMIDIPNFSDLDHTVCDLPLDSETVKLRSEAAILRQEHKDLDDSVAALATMPVPDQILIARLKRKKLFLRDQITTLEDRIRPDIIA